MQILSVFWMCMFVLVCLCFWSLYIWERVCVCVFAFGFFLWWVVCGCNRIRCMCQRSRLQVQVRAPRAETGERTHKQTHTHATTHTRTPQGTRARARTHTNARNRTDDRTESTHHARWQRTGHAPHSATAEDRQEDTRKKMEEGGGLNGAL